MNFIILTSAEADKVRGVTTLGNALAPFPLVDGTFILPLKVLADTAHEVHWPLLTSLPIRPVDLGTPSNIIGKPPIGGEIVTDPVLFEQSAYKSDWPVGATIDSNGVITPK